MLDVIISQGLVVIYCERGITNVTKEKTLFSHEARSSLTMWTLGAVGTLESVNNRIIVMKM